jgi:hypothetical protein
MGKSLGDKIVMSSHALLLAVVAVASANFRDYPRCATRRVLQSSSTEL